MYDVTDTDRNANQIQIVYIIIALTSWYYPNAELATSNGNTATAGGGEGVAKMLRL